MKMRVRVGAALAGIMLSLAVVSAFELVYEANARPTFNLIFQDLRLAVLQYKAKKYSVKTWLKRELTVAPSRQSFPELQVFVIKRI
jgi:hypothetical protein